MEELLRQFGSVVLGGAMTLAGTMIANRRARKDAEQRAIETRRESDTQRGHDRRERRFDRRLDAFTRLDATTATAVNRAGEAEAIGKDSPEVMGIDPWDVPTFREELSSVEMLGSERVREAAAQLAKTATLFVWTFDGYAEYEKAREDFLAAVRGELGTSG